MVMRFIGWLVSRVVCAVAVVILLMFMGMVGTSWGQCEVSNFIDREIRYGMSYDSAGESGTLYRNDRNSENVSDDCLSVKMLLNDWGVGVEISIDESLVDEPAVLIFKDLLFLGSSSPGDVSLQLWGSRPSDWSPQLALSPFLWRQIHYPHADVDVSKWGKFYMRKDDGFFFISPSYFELVADSPEKEDWIEKLKNGTSYSMVTIKYRMISKARLDDVTNLRAFVRGEGGKLSCFDRYDVDGDGDVDFADFLEFSKCFGKTVSDLK